MGSVAGAPRDPKLRVAPRFVASGDRWLPPGRFIRVKQTSHADAGKRKLLREFSTELLSKIVVFTDQLSTIYVRRKSDPVTRITLWLGPL